MLARALAKASNLLVLDEPTNDLDLETLDLLQELLGDYPGTILIVSHDRDFLDRCVTSTLVFEGQGRWQEYAGGYSDMVAQRGAGMMAPASPKSPSGQGAQQTAPAAMSQRRKFTFKEKHALETLPARIETLRSDLALVQKRLGDPGLYGRDPSAFSKLGEAAADNERALRDAENSWLELEMLREEIEG